MKLNSVETNSLAKPGIFHLSVMDHIDKNQEEGGAET